MSIDIHQNVVSPSEISVLLEYLRNGDGNFDERPDISTRSPDNPNSNSWPRKITTDIVNRVLDSWKFEYVLFFDSRDSFGIHVDAGDGDQDKLYKNILIPLDNVGGGSTIIFENKWFGPKRVFAKVNASPFSYRLPKNDGKFYFVGDIRNITDISEFDITQDELDNLIFKRSPDYKKPPKARADYSQIEGYDPDLRFDKEFHEKYLSHIPLENLHGLTVKQVIHWKVGDVITWDRQYIHCAGADHQRKKGLTIFTTKS